MWHWKLLRTGLSGSVRADYRRAATCWRFGPRCRNSSETAPLSGCGQRSSRGRWVPAAPVAREVPWDHAPPAITSSLSILKGRGGNSAPRETRPRKPGTGKNPALRRTSELSTIGSSLTRNHRLRLARAAGTLDALSPLKVLERGFAVTTDRQGNVITSAEQVALGDRLELRLHRGMLEVEVRGSSQD
ncbi:MAG TPA: hypothetical protein ENJ18_10680 [Nannocystis exedens]|nr:hypothetical protein [Nannocystis exedens]